MFSSKFLKQANLGIFTHFNAFLPKMGHKLTFDFIASYERAVYKLSENLNLTVIGPSKLKLWSFEIHSYPPPPFLPVLVYDIYYR